jgi:two-component system, OmpR family, sensor kinase
VPAPSSRSIVWPILALVLVSVMLATVVIFVVTFSGPPPRDPPRGLQSIARTLRTGHQPAEAGPPLTIQTLSQMPKVTDERFPMRDNPVIRAQLAGMLRARLEDVHAYISLQPIGIPDAFVGRYVFAWRTPGGWRVVENARPPWFQRWHWKTLAAMLLTLVALALPAWALARTISHPLRQLADAAEQARAGGARPTFPTGGPAEVRALTAAVSDMQDRLVEHAESRTRMLAAIAHDLGTPLARLAFWIEHLPEAARDRAVGDIDEMRAMIGDVLGFARDEAGARDATLVELGSLLDSLAEDMAVDGAAVSLEPGPRAVVRGDPRQLRRAFANLIGNALRYGGSAAIGWRVEGGEALVAIEDEGPGIDPALAERLFEPFVRGEESRNRATGGTGLGLTIVRAILTRHGGRVRLANRAERGAVATVTLPVARS